MRQQHILPCGNAPPAGWHAPLPSLAMVSAPTPQPCHCSLELPPLTPRAVSGLLFVLGDSLTSRASTGPYSRVAHRFNVLCCCYYDTIATYT